MIYSKKQHTLRNTQTPGKFLNLIIWLLGLIIRHLFLFLSLNFTSQKTVEVFKVQGLHSFQIKTEMWQTDSNKQNKIQSIKQP